ncbi:MAG: hypothetical protein J0I41_01885 [Filimonas sp.]|nr:hypothetical protein [Filimonas sp.]
MKTFFFHKIVFFLIACILYVCAAAQNLTFTNPVAISTTASTDKGVDIIGYKKNFFIAWKEAGEVGRIHVACFRSHNEHLTDQDVIGSSNYAPVFRIINDKGYLFWIDVGGKIKYVITANDSSFNVKDVYVLPSKNEQSPTDGITCTLVGKSVILATHTGNKNQMMFAITKPDAEGRLGECVWQSIPQSSPNYPIVTAIDNENARFCWRSNKGDVISYADYNVLKNTWSEVVAGKNTTASSPAVYSILADGKLFYIWRGAKKDTRVYYAVGEKGQPFQTSTMLPAHFSTYNPVATCSADDNSYMMAYTGLDQKIYVSYFSGYNPSSWMQDILLPTKGHYTLRDIVIPGSHDAGMSVLNGIGGTVSTSINDCNTLTQTISIGKQLNAGIRMFDLRAGMYKNYLYTKHFSSDCLDQAAGGGYGERLYDVLTDVKQFMERNKGEIVILGFSHFCEADVPTKNIADFIVQVLGEQLIWKEKGSLDQIPLQKLAGKVIVVFEDKAFPELGVASCFTGTESNTFMNFKREYAATNDLNKLLAAEEGFFNRWKGGVKNNDLIRLDWQLTQSTDEAAMICNDFQSQSNGAVLNGTMLLVKVLRKYQSIRDMAAKGNKMLVPKVTEWIGNGTINKLNKPNVLYVDVAGEWITDFCIDLNKGKLYEK